MSQGRFCLPKNPLLSLIFETLIYTLRTTATTGSVMFFAEEQAVNAGTATLAGLYYRNSNTRLGLHSQTGARFV